jgi:hypothetical protein
MKHAYLQLADDEQQLDDMSIQSVPGLNCFWVNIIDEKFRVITGASRKIRAFWDIASVVSLKLADVSHMHSFHHQGDDGRQNAPLKRRAT